MAQNFNPTVAELFISGLLLKKNVAFTNVFFNWRLIYPDMDDNKFVDCAIAANADYLVTNDRDFSVLKKVEFPKIILIKIDEFIKVLESLP